MSVRGWRAYHQIHASKFFGPPCEILNTLLSIAFKLADMMSYRVQYFQGNSPDHIFVTTFRHSRCCINQASAQLQQSMHFQCSAVSVVMLKPCQTLHLIMSRSNALPSNQFARGLRICSGDAMQIFTG